MNTDTKLLGKESFGQSQSQSPGKVVLLIEDSEDDIFFMQRAWKQANVMFPLQVVRDGQQAQDYLSGSGKYSDRKAHPMPCLVLLDWKLPYVMGAEVLRWIRDRPATRTLPVLVLSSSVQKSDIDSAYRIGANAYLEKPSNQRNLAALIELIKPFWLGAIQRPPDFI